MVQLRTLILFVDSETGQRLPGRAKPARVDLGKRRSSAQGDVQASVAFSHYAENERRRG
jgi:hypothetical protein